MVHATFQETVLGEILDFYNGKSIKPGGEGKYPVYGSNGIIGYSDEYKYSNALIIGRVGAYCGSIEYCKSHFWASDNTIVTKPKDETHDVIFLYYLLKELNLNRHAGGAAQPLLTQGTLKQVTANLPPLPAQRKIASILSAYDDLIENNTRRIKILEEMAQMIYREWFVKFRFPGANVETSRRGVSNPIRKTCHRHVSTKMVDSAMGEIPEGWEVRKVTEAIEINPRTSVPRDGEKSFVPMGSLSTNSMLISDIEYRTSNSGSKFKNGDTLFARITPCLENGKTAFVQFLPTANAAAFGSTEFIVLRSKTLCPEYVYLMARSDEFRNNAIKSMSGATGRQRVNEKCFEQFFIAQPDGLTLQRFSEQISPMFKGIHNLAKKNKTLRQTRDLLLPKLISGEVDVEGLAILTES